MKSVFGFGSTTVGSEIPINNRTHNSGTYLPSSAQRAGVQMSSEIPKVNFNINLFHPNQNIDHGRGRKLKNTYYSFDDELKINYKKQNNLISMLKNEANDSVDSKDHKDLTVKKRLHRTLSF